MPDDKPNMLHRVKLDSHLRAHVETIGEVVEQMHERNALLAENAQFRALLDRAAHIVTGCAALLCERGCQDEVDLDAFAAEIRKALEEKP